MAKESAGKPSEVMAPRNFLAFIGAGFRLYRLVAGRVMFAFAASIGLVYLVLVGITYFTSTLSSDINLRALGAGFLIAQTLLPPFVGSLLVGRSSRVIANQVAGRRVSLREAGPPEGSRSHLFAAAMLSAFLVLAVSVAMGLVGFFLGAQLLLGPPLLVHVIALERLSFTDGWARTREIVRGNALRMFLYLLCIALGLMLVEFPLAQGISALLLEVIPTDFPELVFFPVLGIVIGVGMSLMSAFMFESYLDLRAREDEDFDFEQLAEELEQDDDDEEEEPDSSE